MHLVRIAAAFLLPAQIALAGHALAQRGAPDQGAAARTDAEPRPLSERDILFAHHRLLGTEPDFRVLAEQEVDNRPAPTRPIRNPGRNPERERRYLLVLAERRIRAEFAAFDPGRTYRATMRAEILGYDPGRGGIPLRAGLRHGFSMRDATNRDRGFTLRFRNPGALAVIPAGPEAAATMLEEAGLASLGRWAGYGVLTVDFVLAGALPALPDLAETPLLAAIVSAHVGTTEGRLLHDFLFPGARTSAAALRRSGVPPLRTAELSGVRIGMSLAEARGIALRDHPQAVATAFYAGLPQPAGEAPECSEGLVAELRAFSLPLPAKDSFTGCLALLTGEAEGPEAGRVTGIVQLRFLPGTGAAGLRDALEHDLGTPEETAGGQLLWLGRDPAREDAPALLERRAEMVELEEGGPDRVPGTLLATVLRPSPVTEEDGS